MIARLAVLSAFALPVGTAPAAPVPKLMQKKKDGGDIVGLWTDQPGQPTGWVFNSDGTAGVGDPINPSCKAVYKVDPTQTPKHLDWSQDGGKTWYLGIYDIEDDKLKINFGTGASGVRPTVLGPNTGSQWVTGTRNPAVGK